MQTIVITGSTRGIGYGLADEFLKRGCRVVVSGRSQASVDNAVRSLAQTHPHEMITGQPCDVTDYAQVQALWDAAIQAFDRIDIWINNAGISHPPRSMWQLTPEKLKAVVNTNMLGAINGSHVAMNGMKQQGGGFIYNMEGFGSQGKPRANLVLYGSTKRGLQYFTDGLRLEAKDNPVKVCSISPGMVVTDLLFDGFSDEEIQRSTRIFNILSDKVETVTPYLAEKVLENDKDGARIAWLTTPKIAWRFMTAAFNKRDVISDSKFGERVRVGE